MLALKRFSNHSVSLSISEMEVVSLKPKSRMIRLLCVGVGGMGKYDSDAALSARRFQAVGGVDVNNEALKQFEEKWKCPVFTDFNEALRKVRADAALIAVPDAFHAPYSLAAMVAGLDVICEKPMAATLNDAHRMCRTSTRTGRMLMVHHQLRWLPAYRKAKEIITRGDLGDLQSVEFDMSVFSNVCLVGYRSRMSQLMLKDLGIHHLDLLRYLVGEEPTSVMARSWISREQGVSIPTNTHAVAIVEMAKGIVVSYRGTMRGLHDTTGYSCKVKLTGSKGSLLVTGESIQLHTFADASAGKPPRKIGLPRVNRTCWQDFADAIITRKPALTDCHDTIKSMELMCGAIRSAETGRIVKL